MDAARKDYGGQPFDIEGTDPDPTTQFERWFADASDSVDEPNAMVLATAEPDGRPAARVVLLKEIDDGGFVFYTNRSSAKGGQLQRNPRAALCFHWQPLHRQVRIEGRVEPVEDDISDAYFRARPEGARIGAAASPQSRVIPDREWLERRAEEVAAAGIPDRPADWGGYRVLPDTFEFWQGRPNRLHDRIRYRREDGMWVRERLAP